MGGADLAYFGSWGWGTGGFRMLNRERDGYVCDVLGSKC